MNMMTIGTLWSYVACKRMHLDNLEMLLRLSSYFSTYVCWFGVFVFRS